MTDMHRSSPFLLLLVLLVYPASGQTPDVNQDTFAFRYAMPGRTTIDVNVLGAVGKPGVWKISSDVDLIELLSVVQVPGTGRDEAGLRENVMINVYRTVEGVRTSAYSESLEQILSFGAGVPTLENGDVLVVITHTRKGFGFQRVIQTITAAASLSLLILRLSRGR